MSLTAPDIRFSVAPMMDWTDRHDRFFMRLMSKRARLYTEMVTADAVRYGNRDKLLAFNEQEHPLALQLGGSSPEALAEAAKIGEDYGYDEINLNVGCPSDRVQSGSFGACLMQEPDLVADCVAAMRAAVKLPVTVKSRIGVDDQEPREALFTLVEKCKSAGITHFIVHARKAWLDGLSPKENRDIPPLDYDRARRLAAARGDLQVILNGGLDSKDQALAEADGFAGIMLGRAAYRTPMVLADIAAQLFATPIPARRAIANGMADYADEATAMGVPLHSITRHMLGLYHGQRGARLWRRRLGEDARNRTDGGTLIREVAAVCEMMNDALAA